MTNAPYQEQIMHYIIILFHKFRTKLVPIIYLFILIVLCIFLVLWACLHQPWELNRLPPHTHLSTPRLKKKKKLRPLWTSTAASLNLVCFQCTAHWVLSQYLFIIVIDELMVMWFLDLSLQTRRLKNSPLATAAGEKLPLKQRNPPTTAKMCSLSMHHPAVHLNHELHLSL